MRNPFHPILITISLPKHFNYEPFSISSYFFFVPSFPSFYRGPTILTQINPWFDSRQIFLPCSRNLQEIFGKRIREGISKAHKISRTWPILSSALGGSGSPRARFHPSFYHSRPPSWWSKKAYSQRFRFVHDPHPRHARPTATLTITANCCPSLPLFSFPRSIRLGGDF